MTLNLYKAKNTNAKTKEFPKPPFRCRNTWVCIKSVLPGAQMTLKPTGEEHPSNRCGSDHSRSNLIASASGGSNWQDSSHDDNKQICNFNTKQANGHRFFCVLAFCKICSWNHGSSHVLNDWMTFILRTVFNDLLFPDILDMCCIYLARPRLQTTRNGTLGTKTANTHGWGSAFSCGMRSAKKSAFSCHFNACIWWMGKESAANPRR